MPTKEIGGLMSITLCQLMEQLRPKTGNPLKKFVLFILLILCLHNFSNKLYHGTGEDQLSAHHKIRTGYCCLGEHCVSSCSSYGLKQGVPWHFLFIYNLLISYLPLLFWLTIFLKYKNIQNCS